MERGERTYLGDGVYLEYDGLHYILKANSPTEPTDTIYLDHYTLAAFLSVVAPSKEDKNV